MEAREFIDKIIKEWEEHINKGNKTLGTLPMDWTNELEILIEDKIKEKQNQTVYSTVKIPAKKSIINDIITNG